MCVFCCAKECRCVGDLGCLMDSSVGWHTCPFSYYHNTHRPAEMCDFLNKIWPTFNFIVGKKHPIRQEGDVRSLFKAINCYFPEATDILKAEGGNLLFCFHHLLLFAHRQDQRNSPFQFCQCVGLKQQISQHALMNLHMCCGVDWLDSNTAAKFKSRQQLHSVSVWLLCNVCISTMNWS